MQIRDEGERARVGTPGWILHVDAEVREGAWHTAGAWHDVQLRGRRCDRIARISEIAALIESRVHPIVDLPLESFGELSLRRVGVRWRPHARPAHERDPAVVGTEDRRRRDAIDLEGLPHGNVHAQEPRRALLTGVRRRGERTATRGECEERSVGAPARIGRAERGIADANRRRRTIRRRQPYFALTSVLVLDVIRADVGDAFPVGGKRRSCRRLDTIIVLELERPHRVRCGAYLPRRRLRRQCGNDS